MKTRPTPEVTRREEVPGRPVSLADGNEWELALPTVRYSPAVAVTPDAFGRPVQGVAVAVGFGYPVEIQSLIAGLRAACERGTEAEQYAAFFSLAAALLRRAHDIDLPTACELLGVADPELPSLARAVLGAVSGNRWASPDDNRGDTTP